MIKNLNEMSATTLNRLYNNTSKIQIYFDDEIGQAVNFSSSDITNGQLIIRDMLIKNCVVVTPSGDVWNALDYYHSNGNTHINFKYIETWESGSYTLYIGNSEEGSFLQVPILNVNEHSIVDKHNNIYKFKKITSDNTIKIQSDENQIKFSISDNVSTQCLSLTSTIDCSEYSTQIFYVVSDATISDIINGNIVTVLLYKPNETLLTYNDKVILNPYDIGWYTFVIKKIFNKLFIGQPTKVITDYVPEIQR